MNPAEVTAVVLARDEERNLPRALDSLPRGMPVLVIDAGSRDRTVELAREAGATVVTREWTDFVDARRFALAQVRTPWVFALDADEVLDDRLRAAICSAAGDADGYAVSRDTYFRERPLRIWRGEKLVRLLRASAARVDACPVAGGTAALHERYACEGSTPLLDGTLLHFSYRDTRAYREKYARYTALEAAGVAASVPAWLGEIARGVLRLGVLLFGRGALLDGADGVLVAWYTAFYAAAVRRKALARR